MYTITVKSCGFSQFLTSGGALGSFGGKNEASVIEPEMAIFLVFIWTLRTIWSKNRSVIKEFPSLVYIIGVLFC